MSLEHDQRIFHGQLCSKASNGNSKSSIGIMHPTDKVLMKTRGLPALLRLAGGLLLGVVAFTLHRLIFAEDASYPYVLAFPAVLAAGTLFGRTSGSVTLLLTVIWEVFDLPPGGSFAISNERDAISLLIYSALSSGALVLIQALFHQRHKTSQARADALRAAEQQEAREREHELLLAEFRHRVKNDLARLAATILLRASNAEPATMEALRTAADRVRMFSSIYDQMALRHGQMVTDMSGFLRDLVRDINATIEREHPVGLTLEAEAHTLPFGQASAIAIILNELVTNALKHAFPDNREGAIWIIFRREDDEYVLIVGDDGVGMAVTAKSTRSQGGRIVQALAAQVSGRLLTKPDASGGTRHELRFK